MEYMKKLIALVKLWQDLGEYLNNNTASDHNYTNVWNEYVTVSQEIMSYSQFQIDIAVLLLKRNISIEELVQKIQDYKEYVTRIKNLQKALTKEVLKDNEEYDNFIRYLHIHLLHSVNVYLVDNVVMSAALLADVLQERAIKKIKHKGEKNE